MYLAQYKPLLSCSSHILTLLKNLYTAPSRMPNTFFFCQNARFRLYLGVYACMYTSINYYMPLDVLHCTRTSFWWFTSTPSSISLLTSSSSPPLVAIMRSLQSSIWNTAVLELYCSLTKLDTAIMTYHYLLLFIIYYAVMKCYDQYHDQMIC